MDFKAIFSKKGRSSSQRGFTLAETLMGVGVGGIVVATLMTFAIYTSRSFAALSNHIDLDQSNRTATDRMCRDIRQVNCLTAFTTNTLTFQDYDGVSMVYTYNSTNKTLVRTKSGVSTTLLQECDSLNFTMLQRNIIEGSYDYYTADEVETCKVIGVSWACSRNIGNKKQITAGQDVQAVIRKQ